MRKSPKFSPEVVERSVRMVLDSQGEYESQWAAVYARFIVGWRVTAR